MRVPETTEEDPHFSALRGSLAHLVRRTGQLLTSVWSDAVDSGITSSQYAVLSVVWAYPGISQQDLGELASLERSTTADVVARLHRHAWLDRRRDAGDARRTLLALTSPALVAMPIVTEQADAAQAALLERLDPAERERLVDQLARVAYPDGVAPDGVRAVDPVAAVRSLTATPVHLLRRIEQRQQRIWVDVVGRAATPTQYAVLCAVGRDTLDQKTVGRLASLDTSNAADVISRLRSQGVLRVIPDVHDRRRNLVTLTPAAFELLGDLTPRAREVHRILSGPLSADEVADLLELLARVSFPVSPGESVA
jgi:MarR family transcriptional regulator, lower aerobic nicotinate degradation pathway regulator